MSNLEFVFKLHPQMSLDYLFPKTQSIKKCPKIVIGLQCSFKSSDWVLYRGSTFIVELLKGLQHLSFS